MKPKYETGEVVRYGAGPRCLAEVISSTPIILKNGRTFKYSCRHISGGIIGIRQIEITKATKSEIARFKKGLA